MGSPLSSIVSTVEELEQLVNVCEARQRNYLISIDRGSGGMFRPGKETFAVKNPPKTPMRVCVRLLFLSQATSEDIITGFLHSRQLRERIDMQMLAASHPSGANDTPDPTSFKNGEHTDIELVMETLEWTKINGPHFVSELMAKGWNVEHIFLEEKVIRVDIQI